MADERTTAGHSYREDMTEEYSFDELAVGLVDGTLSRSRAMKLVGATIVGGVFGFLALPVPEAKARRRKKRRKSTYAFTGSITNSDRTQTGRLVRNGGPSTCTNQKDVPALAPDLEPRHYDVYALKNGSAAACVRVTLLSDPSCPIIENDLQSTTYSPSFNPAVLQQNYVADIGDSPTPDEPVMYSFILQANATFKVVVNEVNPGAGCSYALVVSGLSLP